MASLQPVRVRGRTYWRIVESRRVNGKPRPIPVLHLGTADALLKRLTSPSATALGIRSYEHGSVATLVAAAERLDVVKIVDSEVAKSARGLSVGTTMLLAAVNRAVRPRSKRGWAEWAKGTSLRKLVTGLDPKKLTSEYFWDQMDCISLEALRRIEDRLTRQIVNALGLKLDTLFYDTTNFHTYIATTNARCTIAQRGRAKQKRNDLRLFSLALLVCRDGQIPICTQVYEGNRPDQKQFPYSLTALRERFQALSLELEAITVVFDKGNNSKDNIALIDEGKIGFVASLVPGQHAALADIRVGSYRPIESGRLEGVRRLRKKCTIWGAERTAVLFISERLRAGQIRGLNQSITKAVAKLEDWKRRLAAPNSGPKSTENAEKEIARILSAQHLCRVMQVEYRPRSTGAKRLRWRINKKERRHLETEVFGKRLLMTNRHAWSDEQIILAYRGQSEAEGAFRQLKDDEHLAVRPQYHWTDHKIRVHAFICLLGYLLTRLVEHEARALGWRECTSHVLDRLGELRLAMVLAPSPKPKARPTVSWQLEQCDDEVMRLFRSLVPDKPPFVYTCSAPPSPAGP